MSLLNPEWKKTIVFIGRGSKDSFIGTGVLLHISGIYHLITSKHVVFDKSGNEKSHLFISFNSLKGEIKDRPIDEIKNNFDVKWIIHEDSKIDLAMIPVGIDPKSDDLKTIPENLFSDIGETNLAEDVFFLGFQPGLSLTRVNPLVRSGIISRVEDNGIFYIDTTVFPGNSGSPVFLKPSFVNPSERGTSLGFPHFGKFIGIVGAYIPYQEWAFSQQTGNARVMFEENTGISIVWSVKKIQEIISSKNFQDQLKKLNGDKSDEDKKS